jgi:ankyrin repeat protein
MAAEEAIEAVHRAASEGDAVRVTRMLDEDPRLLSSMWVSGPLLNAAVWEGHVDVVRLLLERGAEVNQANGYGNTALICAICRAHEEMVSILITSGADPSRKSHRGHTALMHASSVGYVPVVRLLLRSMGGVGLNERDQDGRTALLDACTDGRAYVLRALLLAGADHTIADNDDTTPLQVAEEKEHHECVALLQVSTSLMSCSECQHDGTACAVCGVRVVWGRTSQSVPVLQWWQGELQRAYVLHKARTLHEDTATRQQAPAAPVPAYLSARVTEDSVMPSVQVVTIQQEEVVCAMAGFVVKDLAAELYIELLAGFHQ